MKHKNKLLIIEDESAIQKLLAASFPRDDFDICSAFSAEEGIRLAAANNPDLILLDLGLPAIDGFTVIERVREWSQIPIIVLSARTQEDAKIRALDLGANDYVTKPFSVGELLARIRVCLRIQQSLLSGGNSKITAGDLSIDLSSHIAYKKESELSLTPTEFNLLALLIKNADKVMTHRTLLKEVWGPTYAGDVQYLRVFMKQIREKIEENPSRPRILITEPGIGYRMLSEPRE